MKYYIVVGEASGDLHASNLMRSLKEVDVQAEFRFFGGDLMIHAGGVCVKHYRDLAYMGFIPVLLHLRTIIRNLLFCRKDIVEWNPDVLILVDYPGFNLKVARFIRKHTLIPVYYYISPKIWAWKEYRIKNIRRDVNELFSILPFEIEFFKKHHYPIHYVGNPCVDAVSVYKEYQDNKSCLIGNDRPVIALLPGSRKQEIKDNLRLMIQAVSDYKNYQIIVAGAPGIDPSFYDKFLGDSAARILYNQTYDILHSAEAALVTSGTATLETSLFSVPQVVCYYTPCGKLVSFLRKKILGVRYISLVNLVADKEVVKELVADQMTVANIQHELSCILVGGTKRQQMLDDYQVLKQILGPTGASKRAASEMFDCLKKQQSGV